MSSGIVQFKHIHYEPEYSDIEEVYSQYYQALEEFRKIGEDNITARVLSYYYEGFLYIINGDQALANKEYDKALTNYENAHKLIVRSRASRGREGDDIWHEMMKWTYYSEAQINLCKYYMEEKIENKLTLLQYSISNLKLFLEERKLDNNFVDVVYSKGRISFLNYLYFYNIAKRYKNNTKAVKKFLMDARMHLNKANFVFHNYSELLDELEEIIDDITKEHIVERAELHWNRGTYLIAKSDFVEAEKYFAMASQYYERASKICAEFLEIRLYLALSKITKASSIEAIANELYRRQDNPTKASKMFTMAYNIVDEALGLLVRIQNKALITSMTAQRNYYEALALETKGISLFDQEKYKESIENFEEAMQKLNATEAQVVNSSAEHLEEYIRLSKNEIEGYLSMAKTILQ